MTTTTPTTSHDLFARLWCGTLFSHPCSDGADPLRLCLMPPRFITDVTDAEGCNEVDWRNTPPAFTTRTTA
jgi:hypothetical protein